jgi:site-specific recombinase XerD
LFIPSYRDWLRSSVLSQSADAYVGYLQDHRYCPATVRAYLHSVEHFAHWMTKRRVLLRSIDELLVRRFVTEHLPVCNCSGPCQRNVSAVRPALAHLLQVLRGEGRIWELQGLVPQTIQDELDRFNAHLDTVCGLASATRTSRRMWVGKFLVDRFGSAPIEIDRIQPADIVEFMVRPTNHYSPGTAGVLGSALRSYLRYRAVRCEDRVEKLVAAVPTVARWRLATVPAHLTSEEIGRFLGTFDRHTPCGQRGYAMARCLSDMGLRASEVAAIQLDDLNWREGTLTIGRGKSRRADVLPLPVAAGKAIVQYLRGARSQSANRALFVRHRAPFDAPIRAEFVRGTVRRAFARCGLDRYTGTHVLRHSAAMRMRCAGASLKEIADVLRHRSLDTTRIYTKVDLPGLAAVAAPWPGGLS